MGREHTWRCTNAEAWLKVVVVNLVIPPAPTSKIDWGSDDYSAAHQLGPSVARRVTEGDGVAYPLCLSTVCT